RWWLDGAVEAALEGWRQGLLLAEKIGDQQLQVEGHKLMVIALYNIGDLDGAEAQLEQSSKLVAELASVRDEARATVKLGLVKYQLGDIDEAEQLSAQAVSWLERLGDIFYRLQSYRTLALCALSRSEYALAEQRLREAIPLADEVGGPLGIDM